MLRNSNEDTIPQALNLRKGKAKLVLRNLAAVLARHGNRPIMRVRFSTLAFG